MADYPSSVKTFPTLVDLIDSVLAEHQNERGDEITAIETELGTDPRGSSATVKDRLTMLELGWIPDSNTWAYSSLDSPAGVLSIDADMTAILTKGMRLSFDQTQALTGYWSFDSSSTPEVGGFTCTDTNMSYTAGKFSNAATFNGTSSKIVVTDAAGLKPTGEFTIGCRFKTGATGAEQQIFQSYSANTAIAGIKLQVAPNNAIGATIGNNTGTLVGVNYTGISGVRTVTDNAWHYVVLVFRNNYVQLYLDGELEAYGYCITPAYAATNYVRIGCKNTAGTDSAFFNGQVDDLFYINGYALDEGWIHSKYKENTAQGTGALTVNKKAIITNVGAYSAGATLITAYFGTDYSLVNATISNPNYSAAKIPQGFPADPDKWSIHYQDAVDRVQTPVVQNTWYNTGSLSLVLPIGSWRTWLRCGLQLNTYGTAAATSLNVAVSTTNNGASDLDFWAMVTLLGQYAMAPIMLERSLNLRAKTTYYINVMNSSNTNEIRLGNAQAKLVLKAICTYL